MTKEEEAAEVQRHQRMVDWATAESPIRKAEEEEAAEVQRHRLVEWATAANPARYWANRARLRTPFDYYLAAHHIEFLMRRA